MNPPWVGYYCGEAALPLYKRGMAGPPQIRNIVRGIRYTLGKIDTGKLQTLQKSGIGRGPDNSRLLFENIVVSESIIP